MSNTIMKFLEVRECHYVSSNKTYRRIITINTKSISPNQIEPSFSIQLRMRNKYHTVTFKYTRQYLWSSFLSISPFVNLEENSSLLYELQILNRGYLHWSEPIKNTSWTSNTINEWTCLTQRWYRLATLVSSHDK
jgi:hypothetical protein